MTLPSGFKALEPFAAVWAQNSANARDQLRTCQSCEARQAFYNAMNPLIVTALDRLDTVPIAKHDSAERTLMLLTLAYTHIATAIEVQGPDEVKHSVNRQRLPITRAPADV